MSVMTASSLCYFGTFLAAVVLTPLVGQLARRWGIVDLPNVRKVHALPTPRIGGVAISAAFFVVLVPLLLFTNIITLHDLLDHTRLTTLLGSAFFIALVGLADDVFDLPATYKLIALLAAAGALCASGVAIRNIQLSSHYELPLGLASWPLTMLWIVGVTVSINFIDGLDGLAAGIVAIAATLLSISASRYHSDPVVAILCVCLVGSLSGFLVFNFYPAKIFMGDSGSMFIGYMLAASSVMCAVHGTTTTGIVVPALALTVPIVDASLTLIRRAVLQRRSLFSAERGHIHHNLMDQGLTHLQAVLVLYALTGAAALVGLAVLFWGGLAMAGALTVLVVAVGFVFQTAGSARLGETLAAMRRNRAIGLESRRYRLVFDEMQTHFRTVSTFDAWWAQLCVAAERFDFVALTIPLVNRDGSARILHWRRTDRDLEGCESAKAFLPIHQRRAGDPVRAEVEVAAATFLESAGHRITLFSRLVVDHSLARIPAVGKPPAPAPAAEPGSNGESLTIGPRRGRSRRSATVFAPPSGRPGASRGADTALPAVRSIPTAPTPESPHVAAAGPRIAIVHDFLYVYGGAERVVEQMLKIYPDADLFALFDFLPPGQRDFIANKPVQTSFLQHMPFARRIHRAYLPLMPLAIEQLDVSAYDIVISSSYVAAKGVLTRYTQLHVCYCYTPARFAWDLQNQYLKKPGFISALKSAGARILLHYIRQWDALSANRVDMFLAISNCIGGRIRKTYRRDSKTVYPPVDTANFTVHEEKSDYYLTASRLVPYKRIDLIVDAFARMPDRRLVVVGDGPEFAKLSARATANVRMVGHQPQDRLIDYLQHARAFVFAAEEDFGIAPLEAQACGTPVIAYAAGGATETIVPGRTGIFFNEQSVLSIVDAINAFEAIGPWDAAAIRKNAERFSTERFREEFRQTIDTAWHAFAAETRPGAIAPPLPPAFLAGNGNGDLPQPTDVPAPAEDLSRIVATHPTA
jgi:UDP-N-acetylmuramyl pentapeptide phosphotransferase/UDP-N-acetylglucosamine-1-phosphate transferase/glycosyltransferase involved in cell wall biosynthesis